MALRDAILPVMWGPARRTVTARANWAYGKRHTRRGRDRKKVSAVAIDFTLSDSQQELQKSARAFADGVLRPVAGRIDRAADGWESFLAGREAYREMAH